MQRVSHATHPKMTSGRTFNAGSRSIRSRRRARKKTQLPSLELGLEQSAMGACESAYSCTYYNDFVGRAGNPLPMEKRRARSSNDCRRQHGSERAGGAHGGKSRILDFVSKT